MQCSVKTDKQTVLIWTSFMTSGTTMLISIYAQFFTNATSIVLLSWSANHSSCIVLVTQSQQLYCLGQPITAAVSIYVGSDRQIPSFKSERISSCLKVAAIFAVIPTWLTACPFFIKKEFKQIKKSHINFIFSAFNFWFLQIRTQSSWRSKNWERRTVRV